MFAWFNGKVLSLVFVFACCGCSRDSKPTSTPSPPTVEDRITAGDLMSDAVARLEAWGGEGVQLSRYSVSVPSKEDIAAFEDRGTEISEPSQQYRFVVPSDKGAATTQGSGFGQPITPPDTQTYNDYDGYQFEGCTVILNGSEFVIDIEVVTHGLGGRSTEVSSHGNKLLLRADVESQNGT